MYWTDKNTHKIQRANLDGSNIEDIVTMPGSNGPHSIALDMNGRKMYWTDSWTYKVQRADFDGSNIEDISIGLGSPHGIALGIVPTNKVSAAAPAAVEILPDETRLHPNYPNPSNPETWIPYQLASPENVTLTIYTVNGQLIRTLALGYQPAGIYQNRSRAVYWDGKNELGEKVASGVYFYTFTAGDFTATRKMLIRNSIK